MTPILHTGGTAVLSTVLVTGGSGFLGGHCILQLLAGGYDVRTTVRNSKREGEVRAVINRGGYEGPPGRLEFSIADLESDASWPQAVHGCDYVLHFASAFGKFVPEDEDEDEDEQIRPARTDALRVLRAAAKARVKRVVLTSSFVVVGGGHRNGSALFDETDWTDLASTNLLPYPKSNTVDERGGLGFCRQGGGRHRSRRHAARPVAPLRFVPRLTQSKTRREQ